MEYESARTGGGRGEGCTTTERKDSWWENQGICWLVYSRRSMMESILLEQMKYVCFGEQRGSSRLAGVAGQARQGRGSRRGE
jgi:hypothetical protein